MRRAGQPLRFVFLLVSALAAPALAISPPPIVSDEGGGQELLTVSPVEGPPLSVPVLTEDDAPDSAATRLPRPDSAFVLHASVSVGSPLVADVLSGLSLAAGYGYRSILLQLEGTFALSLLPDESERRFTLAGTATYRAWPDRRWHPEGGLGLAVVHFGRRLINQTEPTWSTHAGVLGRAGVAYGVDSRLDLFFHAEMLIGLPGDFRAVPTHYVSQLMLKLGARGWLDW